MVSNRAEALFLFLGDAALLYLSLLFVLLLRYGLPLDQLIIKLHFLPFSLLFVSWVLVFFIAGLYEQHTLLFLKRLPYRLLRSVAINAVIAAVFFYFFPAFLITPRANLFLFLIVSSPFLFLWRLYGFMLLGARGKQPVLLVGSGAELRELEEELLGNSRYGIRLVSSIDVSKLGGMDFMEEGLRRVYAEGVTLVIIDARHAAVEPILPRLYNLLFSRVRFVDLCKVYEEIFGRVPLSLLRYSWFLEHVSAAKRRSYVFLKRLMDIAISLPLFALALVLYPFIALAIRLEDGGPVYIAQERVGQNGRPIKTYKFRSMARNEEDPTRSSSNSVTRVGALLRRTRLDELPQLWSVLLGDMSLVGPRPELPKAVKHYTEEIPYYTIRHLIKPGLSGWAQIYHENHPHHAADVSETKVKLSYDLYYLKNQSLFLDVKIALKTIAILLSRSGA